MHPDTEQRIVIAGAGLAGSLLSLFLARRGYDVVVYEGRPDLRTTPIDAGRSINLALSARGLHALDQVGLTDEILRLVIPMRGRMIHDLDGTQTLQPYSHRTGEHINAISRADLNKQLLDAAEATGRVTVRFNHRCTAFDLDTRRLHVEDTRTGATTATTVPRVLGCDGAGSAIRQALTASPGFSFTPEMLDYGYKELTIPPAPGGGWRLEKHALHIWPRHRFMLIALPNLDGSFTCTLFLRLEGPESFAGLAAPADVRAFFERHFPDAVPLMPDLTEEFFENPTGTLGTVRCRPWHHEDAALILGDAAHAIVPFFGQGMNCAFEDCATLDGCLERFGPDWRRVFETFYRLRKPNADAIAELSLQNFIEMRDRVADPRFLLRKQVEFELERRHPDRFIPRYSMVSFHRIPYAEVLRRGAVQEEILSELIAGVDTPDAIDWERAARHIEAALPPLDAHPDVPAY
ncbi:MAG: kynurenine 3-monooxygenase [Rhodothermaceae bacterium]|nr:MAG: kynurenine 3-monooxygenase [Rhodothermaceae bacterium]